MTRIILIVDDIAANRLILKEMLHKDYDILEAAGGEEALELLSNRQTSISAVLLDISMPGIDGFEVLHRIRSTKKFSQMPVIMITGSEDKQARIKSLTLGANDFVMKPYSSEILKHCLRNNIALREAAATVSAMQRDQLTGLYSRESFFEKVREMVAAHEPGYYIMACFDINKFKVINDRYGMQMGDEVLQHTADVFREGFAPYGGVCCRVSADKFAVLYPASFKDMPEIDTIRGKASHMDGIVSAIHFSIGRYLIDDVTMLPATMFDRAMLAAASIKGRYDTTIAVYSDSMREHLIREQEIVLEMEDALQAGQFEAWFQPQYNHATDAMIGAEALVRWRHPQKGLIPPNEFIPIFEQNGFIYALDKFVWESVCQYLRRWTDEGRSPLPVSVNVSRYDLLRPDIVTVLCGLVRKYDLPLDWLRLEITETAFAEASQQVVAVVKDLLNCGFTVEIDDFGSGYSSLNTLKDVPAQIIKLDMKFLESSDDSQRGGNIVESVVRMAKWLGMSVIAEGVETLEQADYLRSIGCNYMQGYLYARPMPADKYEVYCSGSDKEERLLTLETVENLDNNAFWDPRSMDTLIFNSYVGGACIYEYHNGNIELLRATEKYAQVIDSAGMTVEDALKLNWTEHLEEESSRRVIADLAESIATKKEVTGEYVFLDLPGCPHETYLRSSMRVIASTGERYLVYCTNENITAQRKSEERERLVAEQLKSMMDDMPGGFVRMIVAADGSIKPVYINEGFVKLIGMTHAEVMEIYADDALAGVHPDDIAVVNDVIAGMLANGEALSSRYRLQHSNGSYVWLSVFGRVTKDISGNTFLNVYYSDVTEQVKEEETQKALLDNLPCGAGVYEFNNGQMSLSYQNKSYWKLVGLIDDKFPDPTPMSAVYPEDIQLIMQELSAAIQQNRDVVCDIRLRHLTLGYRAVRLVGRIVHKEQGRFLIYATFTLNDQHSMSYRQMLPVVLSAIMESTTDLSFVKSTNFRYIISSGTFARMVGQKSGHDIIGKTDYDLFDKEMADKFRQDDEALLASGRPLVDIVESIPSEDGTPRYSVTSKYVLRDGSGEVIGLYGVGRDVTKAVVQDNQLRLVNDSVPGGLATYACRDNTLHIVYCNDGFCKLFCGSRESYEQRGIFDPMSWVFEADRPELLRQVKALVKDNIPIDCLFRIHVLGGGYKWINERAAATERRGDIVLFYAILLDVTEHQYINEQLRISEEENALATRLSGSIIMRFDIADRSLTIAPEIAAAHSIPERIDDVPYETVRQGLIAPESAEAYVGFFEAILNGAAAGKVLYRQHFFNDWRWMEGKSSTIFSDDGKPVKAVIFLSDVTEQLEKETIYKKWQHSLEERTPDSYTLFRCNLNRNTSYDTREGTLISFDFDGAGLSFTARAQAYADQCVYKDDRDSYLAFTNADTMLAGYYRGQRSYALEYRELVADGNCRWLRISVDLVEYPNSTDVEAYLMYEDINEAKKAELATKKLSENDPLTGILNRNTFADRVNQIMSSSGPETRHALMMLDLDGFKLVNDVFGHGAGDQTLIDIADDLRSIMRHDDLVARLGGDEFVVFLSNIQNDSDVLAKARQLRALTRKSFSMEVQISASIGIVFAPRDGLDFETLYKKADAALYYVKGSGKDNQAVYSDHMADEHLEPESDSYADSGRMLAEKKRRMLIVEDNNIDHVLLQSIFRDEFIIEKAKDGLSALIRLRHYGSAISVVLLDLMMPGMDGFAVLEKLQESAELRSIPVIIVSGDESRETCLEAIRRGATDFITKPVDTDLLRIRVHSAVSKAENERLRAKNSLLEIMNEERIRYEAVLENTGITFIEFDWHTGKFTYYPSVARYLAGTYDYRAFWQILLTDLVADEQTVRAMQQLVHHIAESGDQSSASLIVRLQTPDRLTHSFRMTVRKLLHEHRFTSRVVIALDDLDYGVR